MNYTLVAQIAPQRSTQYMTLANKLAPLELELSPLGKLIVEMHPITLAGQDYVRLELTRKPDPKELYELGQLAMTSAFFEFYEEIAQIQGPLLRPMDTEFTSRFPREMTSTRRYRGKTNELFTHFMCNVARFSSALSDRPWDTLRVLDPLAGGGTTLLTALVLGADAAGVEAKASVVQSTATFIKQYMNTLNWSCKTREERFKNVGKRWILTLGGDKIAADLPPKRCILAHGDTIDTAQLITGFRPHLVVADLPYGIQHQGKLIDLLTNAVPIWASLMSLGGSMVLAWESRRFPRQEMIEIIESVAPLTILDTAPYNAMGHRVDRVIKERDIVVARLNEALEKENPQDGA